MRLRKGNETVELTNEIQARAFLSAGWEEINEMVERDESLASPALTIDVDNYSFMSDEELAATAYEKGIDIDGMTKRKVINALRKWKAV